MCKNHLLVFLHSNPEYKDTPMDIAQLPNLPEKTSESSETSDSESESKENSGRWKKKHYISSGDDEMKCFTEERLGGRQRQETRVETLPSRGRCLLTDKYSDSVLLKPVRLFTKHLSKLFPV